MKDSTGTTAVDSLIKKLPEIMTKPPGNLVTRPNSKNKSIILKSNNSLAEVPLADVAGFDIHSKSSAAGFLLNEFEQHDHQFEERIQASVEKVWTLIESKQEAL